VHLGYERARGVDRREAKLVRLAAHRRRDAVGREHDRRSLGNLPERLDEDRAARPQVLDDVRVVDDLLADEDRPPVERECALDRLDRPFDARAVAPRRREEKALDH
jgi:hypothetical protein